jgi:hypothetical protein
MKRIHQCIVVLLLVIGATDAAFAQKNKSTETEQPVRVVQNNAFTFGEKLKIPGALRVYECRQY